MAARKTSALPTRVWRFHAGAPIEGADLAVDLGWRAARYYNRLIEIERARHARYTALRRRYAPALAALEDAWETLDEEADGIIREAKRARAQHWRQSKGDRSLMLAPALSGRIKEIDAEKKRISSEAKEHRASFAAILAPARAEYKRRTEERVAGGGPRIKQRVNAEVHVEMLVEDWPEAWKEIADSDRAAQDGVRAARAGCGLPSGMYLLVEDAVARAKKDSLPRAPRFRSARGDYRIGAQIKDSRFIDLFGAHRFFDLAPDPKSGKKGRSEEHFLARVRIGSEGREPIWMTLPVRLHRRPPDDAIVKWAIVHAWRNGERMRYELHLTLEHESFSEPRRPAGTGDGGHVRIGWGKVDGGVCVATWRDGDVVVPDEILRGHDYAAAVRGAADKRFDLAKRYLRLWMRGGPHRLLHWDRVTGDRRRVAFRRVCEDYARYVLGTDVLITMWRAWVAERKAQGRDLFTSPSESSRWLLPRGHTTQEQRVAWWLYTWTRKDAHLRQLSADTETKYHHRRDAIFRREAIRIATAVETITVDGYQIAPLKQRPELVTSDAVPNDTAQHNAHAAAPGRFREILLEVMGPRCRKGERSGAARSSRDDRTQDSAGDAGTKHGGGRALPDMSA